MTRRVEKKEKKQGVRRRKGDNEDSGVDSKRKRKKSREIKEPGEWQGQWLQGKEEEEGW